MKQAVLSLSGGLDSTSLLLKLLVEEYEITAIGINYGQKHVFELQQANRLIEYLKCKNFPVSYSIIELKGLSELLVSGLVDNNSMDLLKGHYAHENAKTSVVPNRNSILASLAFAVALSRVKRVNQDCIIALATHLGDFDNNKKEGIYPDCSEEFKQALEYAFKIGNWDSERVSYQAPYNNTNKTGVLKDGINSCEKLKLDYKEIYSLTNTSYAPINIKGKWFSDFKSGSSIERIEAFINLGIEDPVQYADENSELVEWNVVKDYVNSVCKEWKQNLGK